MSDIAVTKLVTKVGNSYWNENGAYWDEYSELWDKLVPSSGEAKTVHGELIRCMGRLGYEFYNNGNCNSVEQETVEGENTYSCYECCGNGEVDNYAYDEEDDDCDELEFIECEECGGSGEQTEIDEYDGDKIIDDYYQDMIDFLHEHLVDSSSVYALTEFLLGSKGYSTYEFNDEEYKIYNDLGDAVMYQVLTTENKDI